MNSRITPRERGLIKGALRRAFSRSDLRKQALELAIVEHSDLSRPRVKSWFECGHCGVVDAKSYCVIDHISPVIPVDKSFEEMSLDEVVNRMWCSIDNLMALCDNCHSVKTKLEQMQRKGFKNGKRIKDVKRTVKTDSKRASRARAYKGCRRKSN